MTAVAVKAKRNEPVEKMLRRFKRAMNEAGTLRELKERKHFKKPGVKRREKAGRARARLLKEALE